MKEKDKLIYKVVFYGAWVMAIGLPVGMFAWAYFSGQITQADQLFKWLLILTVIGGGNIAQYFLNKKHNDFNSENTEELNSEEAKAATKKWAMIVTPVAILGLLISVSQLDYEDLLDKTDSKGLIYLYSIVGVYLLYRLCVKFSPKQKRFVSPVNYWIVYFFIFIIYFFGFSMIISRMNVADNNEESQVVRTILFDGHWVGLNQHRRYCYYIKHWERDETFTSTSFCTSKYPRLNKDEEIELVIKKGKLGFSYIEDIVFPRLRTFEKYIEFIGGEENLRHRDMTLLDKLKGRDFHYHISKEWINGCTEKSPHKCRLASYLYSVVGQKEREMELVTKGCDFNEFISCSGQYLYTKKGTDKKKELMKKILGFCKDETSLPEGGKSICKWYKKEAKHILN
jgi:putative Mn2+ efflux pump MntP